MLIAPALPSSTAIRRHSIERENEEFSLIFVALMLAHPTIITLLFLTSFFGLSLNEVKTRTKRTSTPRPSLFFSMLTEISVYSTIEGVLIFQPKVIEAFPKSRNALIQLKSLGNEHFAMEEHPYNNKPELPVFRGSSEVVNQ